MDLPLENLQILLVEDDPIIGLDLMETLERAGARVVGPAYSVPKALALLGSTPVDAAVLDNLIMDGDSGPVADHLSQDGVVFLFHTSHRGSLRERYPAVPIIDKPSRPGELVRAVKALAKLPR